jgi:catechol 2,3-dioxygenase-like lactoylglutathione lyase family enzyme
LLYHVAICVADTERAVAFYEAVLLPLGIKRVVDRMPVGAAFGDGRGEFWIQSLDAQPFLRITKSAHYAFAAGSEELVVACERVALERGGRSLFAPTIYPNGNNFGCVFSDLDGHMVEVLTPVKRDTPPPTGRPRS